jgi:hypothetical protein
VPAAAADVFVLALLVDVDPGALVGEAVVEDAAADMFALALLVDVVSGACVVVEAVAPDAIPLVTTAVAIPMMFVHSTESNHDL